MKAVIYAGVSLFCIAAVYGVGDYYNSNTKGAIDNIYKEEEIVEETINEPTISAMPASITTNVIPKDVPVKKAIAKKIVKKLKTPTFFKLENYSRGRIVEYDDKVMEPLKIIKPMEAKQEEAIEKIEVKKTEHTTPVVSPAVSITASLKNVKFTERPKMDFSKFSRAPLKRSVAIKSKEEN